MFTNIILILLLMSAIGFAKDSEAITVKFKPLSTEEFTSLKDQPNSILVDARLNDYYNGWQDPISKTNGHFKKATDFSANWIKILDQAQGMQKEYVTKRLAFDVKYKAINQAEQIIIYSSELYDANLVAEYFSTQKIDPSKIYLYQLDDSQDKSELVTIPKYEKLVSPKFIYDLITTDTAENYDNTHYQLFEVSWGDATGSYNKGHIDKSVHINTDEFEHPPLWSLDEDEDLITFAQLYGINPEATIVLYGEDALASFRAAIILEYMGAKDVRVLNGGLAAYASAAYPLTKKSYSAKPKEYRAFDFSGKKLIDSYSDVNTKMSPDWQLIDGRTLSENEGKITGYSDLKYKGTIPGSIFHGGTFSNTSGGVEDYTNVDNTMRNIHDTITMLKNASVNVNQHMSFYCGSGWRVAQTLFYFQINGYEDTSIYSNGWYEYSDKNKQ